LGLACFALLAGCGTSPPIRFISLSTMAPGTVRPVGGAGTTAPIALGAIRLPPDLDRLALVRRMDANRLDINGTVQWGGPLDELIRHTLAYDLAARLPQGEFILPGVPKPRAGDLRVLLVTFQAFSAGPDNRVTLLAHWDLVDAHTQRTLVAGDAKIDVQAGSSHGGDIAAAMSRALAELADQAASEIHNSGAQ
jgi:uncharacterized lipoprotein YmbA